MVAITTRETYGAELPWQVVDRNFINLATAIDGIGEDVLIEAEAARDAAILASVSSQSSSSSASAASTSAALAASAASTSAAESASYVASLFPADGADGVGTSASGAGSVRLSLQQVLRQSDENPQKYGAVGDGVFDDTAAVQAAVTAGNTVLLRGSTYIINGDIIVPENRKIWVQHGAKVRHVGRWTAYNVDNFTFVNDGGIKVLAMPDAPAKPGWPNTADGTQIGNERGYIEFGGTGPTSSTRGFTVYGFGTLEGPWTGTPNFDISTSPYQLNRKGVASWNCSDVLVRDQKISGFDGEAVYWYGNSDLFENIKFLFNKVHDTRFNALNFNTIAAWKGLQMLGNESRDAYAGIEASAGDLSKNTVVKCLYGIWTGLGGGHGPMHITENNVIECDFAGISATFNPASEIYDIDISRNVVVSAGGDGIVCNKINAFGMSSNIVRGWGRLSPGYAFRTTASCNQGRIESNIPIAPGINSLGAYSLQGTNMEVGPNSPIEDSNFATRYIGNRGNFFGGRAASVTDFESRENSIALHSSDINTVGAGAALLFTNGDVGKAIYAGIFGSGTGYDAAGTNGGLIIATSKATTGGTLQASMRIDSAGAVRLENNLIAPFAYTNTTASSANVFIDPSGLIQRSTSAERYKTQLEPIDEEFFKWLEEQEPMWYRSKCAADNPFWGFFGLSAEKVAIRFPQLVHWRYRDTKQMLVRPATSGETAVLNAAGEITKAAVPAFDALYESVPDTDSPLVPEGVQYERFVPLLIGAHQRNITRIAELETLFLRVTALEKKSFSSSNEG